MKEFHTGCWWELCSPASCTSLTSGVKNLSSSSTELEPQIFRKPVKAKVIFYLLVIKRFHFLYHLLKSQKRGKNVQLTSKVQVLIKIWINWDWRFESLPCCATSGGGHHFVCISLFRSQLLNLPHIVSKSFIIPNVQSLNSEWKLNSFKHPHEREGFLII